MTPSPRNFHTLWIHGFRVARVHEASGKPTETCDLCDLKARIERLEKFAADVQKAWSWAEETTRPGATYIFGNKLRRGVREALTKLGNA